MPPTRQPEHQPDDPEPPVRARRPRLWRRFLTGFAGALSLPSARLDGGWPAPRLRCESLLETTDVWALVSLQLGMRL
jgi:hypothetical protein